MFNCPAVSQAGGPKARARQGLSVNGNEKCRLNGFLCIVLSTYPAEPEEKGRQRREWRERGEERIKINTLSCVSVWAIKRAGGLGLCLQSVCLTTFDWMTCIPYTCVCVCVTWEAVLARQTFYTFFFNQSFLLWFEVWKRLHFVLRSMVSLQLGKKMSVLHLFI